MTDASPVPGPLAGLRVLELADETGQFCGKLLGDLGADVVKIEPLGGEPCRRIGPFLDDFPHPERSLSFWYYNTSKRGMTLDINTAYGRDLFQRLAATADVVLETFRPARCRLGVGRLRPAHLHLAPPPVDCSGQQRNRPSDGSARVEPAHRDGNRRLDIATSHRRPSVEEI